MDSDGIHRDLETGNWQVVCGRSWWGNILTYAQASEIYRALKEGQERRKREDEAA